MDRFEGSQHASSVDGDAAGRPVPDGVPCGGAVPADEVAGRPAPDEVPNGGTVPASDAAAGRAPGATVVVVPRWAARAVLAVGIALAALLPASVVWANHAFPDVAADHEFHADIAWIAQAQVTTGRADGTYAPAAPVTRGQMAAFLRRVAGHDPAVPPSVNAAQLGGQDAEVVLAQLAAMQAQLDTQQAQLDAQQGSIAALEDAAADRDATLATLEAAVAERDATIADLQAEVADLETAVDGQQAELAEVEARTDALTATFAGVSRAGKTLRFIGMNVQVLDGSGTTAGTNGLGNLLVGYDAGEGTRTGSHNLVVGDGHSYASHGGIVNGAGNRLLGPNGAVLAGTNNQTSGNAAAVVGGQANRASGNFAVVTGGWANTASGSDSSVSGGDLNAATATSSSVTGGRANRASNYTATVTGGQENDASGWGSTVSGGRERTVTGQYGWRAGSLSEAS